MKITLDEHGILEITHDIDQYQWVNVSFHLSSKNIEELKEQCETFLAS